MRLVSNLNATSACSTTVEEAVDSPLQPVDPSRSSSWAVAAAAAASSDSPPPPDRHSTPTVLHLPLSSSQTSAATPKPGPKPSPPSTPTGPHPTTHSRRCRCQTPRPTPPPVPADALRRPAGQPSASAPPRGTSGVRAGWIRAGSRSCAGAEWAGGRARPAVGEARAVMLRLEKMAGEERRWRCRGVGSAALGNGRCSALWCRGGMAAAWWRRLGSRHVAIGHSVH